jgi:hypothetical protein
VEYHIVAGGQYRANISETCATALRDIARKTSNAVFHCAKAIAKYCKN